MFPGLLSGPIACCCFIMRYDLQFFYFVFVWLVLLFALCCLLNVILRIRGPELMAKQLLEKQDLEKQQMYILLRNMNSLVQLNAKSFICFQVQQQSQMTGSLMNRRDCKLHSGIWPVLPIIEFLVLSTVFGWLYTLNNR